MSQVSATQTLFRDDFNGNGPISSANWDFNHWKLVDNPAFNGNTNMRQELAKASGGVLHLKLDTYHKGNLNPNDRATFLGDEVITKEKFGLLNGQGVAFEFKARFAQAQNGIVGGMFPYVITDETKKLHDEIDFEALSSFNNRIYTNVYANEPGGVGHVQNHPVNGLTSYHTYRIEWLPNAVVWYVDGKQVRVEKGYVPTEAMAVHLNIWAPLDAGWLGFDPNLQATRIENEGKSYSFDVDYISVERLASKVGTNGADKLLGAATNDWLAGGKGHDELSGLQGNDRIHGEQGDDLMLGHGGADTLRGGRHDDTLDGGAGDDRLVGCGGDDVIVGGKGSDSMKGGEGADTFVLRSTLDSRPGDGRDTIADFDAAQGDRLDLSEIDASDSEAGDQAFAFIGEADFTGEAGELRYGVTEAGVVMSADTDGDGEADMEILLAGVESLAASDLIL